MTLNEFIEEEIKNHMKFKDWWVEQQKSNPDSFGDNHEAQDWLEQYNLFIEVNHR